MLTTIVGLHRRRVGMVVTIHTRPLHVCRMCVKYQTSLRAVEKPCASNGRSFPTRIQLTEIVTFQKVSTKFIHIGTDTELNFSLYFNSKLFSLSHGRALVFVVSFLVSTRFYWELLTLVYVEMHLLGAFSTSFIELYNDTFLRFFFFIFWKLTYTLHKKFCKNCLPV